MSTTPGSWANSLVSARPDRVTAGSSTPAGAVTSSRTFESPWPKSRASVSAGAGLRVRILEAATGEVCLHPVADHAGDNEQDDRDPDNSCTAPYKKSHKRIEHRRIPRWWLGFLSGQRPNRRGERYGETWKAVKGSRIRVTPLGDVSARTGRKFGVGSVNPLLSLSCPYRYIYTWSADGGSEINPDQLMGHTPVGWCRG